MAADEGMAGGTGAAGGGAAEGAEDSTQVVEYAAAIDVAKGSGMVYTRVPGSRGPGVPGGSPAAADLGGGGHVHGGDRADGPAAVRGNRWKLYATMSANRAKHCHAARR